ncbi:Cytotoxic translational repressor of toxin-antitoxin stability system [Halalkaliarchaeum sp. AArc-CO]|uniref:type II toxin-antitoxin system RelE family toxin n=1 Tax=Halalkaliarchaeum sp. AArc-CO TaxID=2866381 RepID=UPI00217DF79E|nr:type II toxin-antitoxin system RelE/ParE family toxin [Halalkaliarchaeum sp. AArc-CO]UWG51829.1 Cytotoxic translational repressor of toxin-antitoxin stability system [Halalkaliarchaeum sp. AArc-CO]
MTTNSDWDWEFRPPAAQAFEALDGRVQERIVSKLDAIVSDEWREPYEYIEPLTGLPHGKIRIGDFRLGAAADRERKTIVIYDIEHRSGAYRPGDD